MDPEELLNQAKQFSKELNTDVVPYSVAVAALQMEKLKKATDLLNNSLGELNKLIQK